MSIQDAPTKNRFIITVIMAISLFFGGVFCSSTTNTNQSILQTPTNSEMDKTTASPTVPSTAANTSTPEDTQTPTVTSTVTPAAGLVLGSNTYLRSGPGTNFRGIELVKKGTAFGIHGKSEDSLWLLVDLTNQLWIQAAVATLTSPIESIPFAPTSAPTPTRTTIPTKTPQPTRTTLPTTTPRPSSTAVPPVSILTIYDNLEHMTELQFKEYKKLIVGKPVSENVEVGNVQEDGKVTLHGPWSPFIFNVSEFCVVVTGVPKDFALSLDGGSTFYLDATINGIVGDYNYYFNCENTLVLNYKPSE